MCLGVDIFAFILYEMCLPSWWVDLAKFGKSFVIISGNTFLALPFLLSWASNDIHGRSFVNSPAELFMVFCFCFCFVSVVEIE